MKFLYTGKFKLLIAIVVIAIALFYFSETDYEKDRRVWAKFRGYLVVEKIEQILINNQALSENEKAQVVRCLREASYYKSNRIGHGPTAQTIITVAFKDGKTEHFGYWGANIFETSPRFLEPKTQFLINSQELADFIFQPKFIW